MIDPKKEQKEQAWGDRTQDSEDDAPEYEPSYRDGSAVNECWASESEGA